MKARLPKKVSIALQKTAKETDLSQSKVLSNAFDGKVKAALLHQLLRSIMRSDPDVLMAGEIRA